MWRSISQIRLFRQYLQVGIQTSRTGVQEEEYSNPTISGLRPPEYSKSIIAGLPPEWMKSNATKQAIRSYGCFPLRQTEAGNDWEKKDQYGKFRCGHFGLCWSDGSVALGWGSAIVLGLQLRRVFERDEEKGENKTRVFSQASAMPGTPNTRTNSMAKSSSPSEKEQKENQMQEKNEKENMDIEVASESLASMYNMLGLELSGSDEMELAAQHFKLGAQAGNSNARFNLAVCYEQGRGVNQNETMAAYWYKEAALQGHAMAQYNYAVFNLLGKGKVKEDESEAILWMKEAANQGICQAQSYLGYWLTHGPCRDRKKGVHLLQEAAKQKDVEAMYQLGFCYEEGIGLSANQVEAKDLYYTAATKGHIGAQCCMGRFYQLGLGGLQQDLAQAIVWFGRASEAGNQEAKESLAVIARLENDESLTAKARLEAKENLDVIARLENDESLTEIARLEDKENLDVIARLDARGNCDSEGREATNRHFMNKDSLQTWPLMPVSYSVLNHSLRWH